MKGGLGAGGAIAIVLVLVAVVAIASPTTITNFLSSLGLGSSVPTGDGDVGTGSGVDCQSTTTPDWDPDAYDINNPGTALTEATNLIRRVGDNAWDTFTQGTAVTNLVPYEKYEYVFGISTTDFTDNAYGPHGFFTATCSEAIPFDDTGLYDDSIETALAATFFNADDAAAAETFSAAQVQTVSVKWSAGSEDVCGNPFIATSGLPDNGAHSKSYPNMICLALNTTTWDTPQWVRVNGVEMDRLPTPIRHTATSGNTDYCYEIPVLYDQNVKIEMRLDADDSSAPADDDTASFYCGNFFINTNTGELQWGIEDNEGNAVGTDAADTVTLDFT